MLTRFPVFFSLIAVASVLTVLTSWIIQHQQYGSVAPQRALFQLALISLLLFLLYGRSLPAYVLATSYVTANAVLYGYEITRFYVLHDPASQLPPLALLTSALLLLFTACSLGILLRNHWLYLQSKK